jgi:hypothetical protein
MRDLLGLGQTPLALPQGCSTLFKRLQGFYALIIYG